MKAESAAASIVTDHDWLPQQEEALQRQLQQGFASLRFEHGLEQMFRVDYEAAVFNARRALFAVATVLIGITPLYDQTLLEAPAGYAHVARLLEFGLEIPTLVLAMLITSWRPTRHWSPYATIVCQLVVSIGIIAHRVAGARYGFPFPLSIVTPATVATLFLGGLRFWFFLPWALATMIIDIAADLWVFGPTNRELYEFISMLFTVSLSFVGAYYIEYFARSTWLQRKLVEWKANSDPLTGLYNRREFERIADRFVRQAARERKAVALAMFDVDDFKAFNDHYGHPAGDDCLLRIGRALRSAGRRPLDLQARLGGEEFAAIWFDPDNVAASGLAQSLCDAVARLEIPHAHSSCASVVTVSAGMYWCRPRPDMTVTELLQHADALLYRAKHEGRNRLAVSTKLTELPLTPLAYRNTSA